MPEVNYGWERLTSTFGIVVLLGLSWLLGSGRGPLRWRIIVGGTLLQLVLAIWILRTSTGQAVFEGAAATVTFLLSGVRQGTIFIVGPTFHEQFSNTFLLGVIPTIIFFAAFSSLLYYWGIVQVIVHGLAWVMRLSLGTHGAETLAAAANVFLGQTEAPILIKPYLKTMSRSELMAVMVGGFATVSGGILAVYTSMGISALHLLSASVISAPASLVIAKIMEPDEAGHSQANSENFDKSNPSESSDQVNEPLESNSDNNPTNALHALAEGASSGLVLALNVMAMLIAFVATVTLCNNLLGMIGSYFGQKWLIQDFLAYPFWPLAFVMGVESVDCLEVGRLLGVKLVLTEFIAYEELQTMTRANALSERSRIIATYALCGFANFASIGVQVGGIGSLVPERKKELAQLGFRAMLGGTLAACMTACVAGILI